MRRHGKPGLLILLLLTSPQAYGQINEAPIVTYEARHNPEYDAGGMVASQNEIASRIGARVLARGGNAVDAAVAVAFALAVTLPRAGNIGGGGFMLVHAAGADTVVAIDYREKAPARATRDMFLDENGDVDEQRARYSHLAVGVPGTVAGLHLAHQMFGTLPWGSLLQPAIALARDGIPVSHDLRWQLDDRKARLTANAATRKYFFDDDGEVYDVGERLVQADLARTLSLIAEEGPAAFYEGEIAALIAADMAAHGGLVDRESLAAYQPAVREPVSADYRGYEVVTMPPPGSGVHLLQMLNVIEHFPMSEFGYGSADSVHVLAEAAKLAYADRSRHLGDPDVHDVPRAWLISDEYAERLARGIDLQRARPAAEIAPGSPDDRETIDTTHISVMDGDGNTVSNTYTLNLSYGAGIAVPGAGFLLNNEMDDFAASPGVPNAFGMTGGDANAVDGNKRPVSSMVPTIVMHEGEAILATGSPGGSAIITAVLQMIVNVIDFDMNVAEATHVPRMHHQWSPDELELEPGFSPDTFRELERRGHPVEYDDPKSALQSVYRGDGIFHGASDPRRPFAAAVGPESVASGQ